MDKHVLLIEDEPNITEAIRFILQREGLHVSSHANGATAVDTILHHSPDMIVLDVMLPNRSGFDILKEVRATPEIADIPILMLTAKGQEKDREQAEACGASQFMTKPFSNQEILAAIQTLVA